MGKVFISYTQESPEHNKSVKDFADKLRSLGVDVEIDKYTPSPQEGWSTYMVRNIIDSEFVLCVCTDTYKKRFEQREPIGKGKGAKFEGKLITEIIYENELNERFIPVFLDKNGTVSQIPVVLSSYTRYIVSDDADFIELYSILTHQSKESKPPLGKIVSIDKLQKQLNVESSAQTEIKRITNKCIARFISNGLSKEKSKKLLDSIIESNCYDYLMPSDDDIRSTYIIGDFGSGKSLALSILYLQKLRNNEQAYFISAVDLPVEMSLEKYINLENITIPTTFYIDGLDEISYNSARKIIESIIVCETSNEMVEFFITSRPNTAVDERCHVVSMKPLSFDESMGIIEKIVDSNNHISQIRALGDKISDTICNPFFAILFAQYLEKNNCVILSKQDLIEFLIKKSIAPLGMEESLLTQLEKLSIMYVEHQMNKILISSMNSAFNILEILKTGLIQLDGDYIYFGLPIVPQWLAAKAIKDHLIDIHSIINNDYSIIKWRYPLMILFGNISFEESIDIFSEVVLKYPGIASRIIRDNIITDYIDSLPSPNQCAEMIVSCMNLWIESLGELSKYILPMDNDKLCTFHILTHKPPSICLCWENEYIGKQYVIASEVPKWSLNIMSNKVVKSSIWPWIYTFEYLSHNMKNLLKNPPIFMDVDELREERFYDISRGLLDKGSLFREDLDIANIIEHKNNSNYYTRKYSPFTIKALISHLENLKTQGKNTLKYPHIKPNVPYENCRYVWEVYDTEQQIKLTADIFSKALTAYSKLSNGIFKSLGNTMSMNILQPARVVVNYYKLSGEPCIQWYILCKSNTECNEVDIKQTKKENDEINAIFSEMKNSADIYRVNNSELCSMVIHSQVLRLFNELPLTNLVMNWLKSDLKNIGWIE